MKPVAYFPIGFLVVTVLLTLIFGEWIWSIVPKEQFGIVTLVIWGCAIVLGLAAGLFYQKRPGYLKMRPLFYWPLIGLLAGLFTKGATASESYYYVFPVWIALGIVVGGLVEWRLRSSKHRA